MRFTVRDAMSMEKFKNLQLVAGSNGLSRQIVKIGILDYEFTTKTVSTYIPGEFVTTSFLYAKDDEAKMLEATQKLNEIGASGLAIKNVFFDVLPPIVKDYADRNNFPIFLVDVPIYFEDLIVEFADCVRIYSDYSHYEEIIDSVFENAYGEKQIEKLAKEICPNVKSNYFFAFLSSKINLITPEIVNTLVRFKNILPSSSYAVKYRNGFLLSFSSCENGADSFRKKLVLSKIQQVKLSHGDFNIGIGNLKLGFGAYKQGILEALDSSRLCGIKEKGLVLYDEVGVFSIFLRMLENYSCLEYSKKIVSLLQDYDAENHSDMLVTAKCYVKCGGSIKKTAAELFQHENTVRYRVNKIKSFFPYAKSECLFFEELAIAIQIYFLKDKL